MLQQCLLSSLPLDVTHVVLRPQLQVLLMKRVDRQVARLQLSIQCI